MPYCKDMDSRYRFLGSGNPKSAIAVGWLGAEGGFPEETVDVFSLAQLKSIYDVCVTRLTRGVQPCPLCGSEVRYLLGEVGGVEREEGLGSAELWIPKSDDEVWVAPNLLLHYVAHHRYGPPAGFWDDVGSLAQGRLDWRPDDLSDQFVGRYVVVEGLRDGTELSDVAEVLRNVLKWDAREAEMMLRWLSCGRSHYIEVGGLSQVEELASSLRIAGAMLR